MSYVQDWEPDRMEIGKMIQQARVVKGINTQRELAIAVGVTPGIINSYESGKATPDPVTMQKLERVLNVKLTN
jgi:putative transcription factor